MHSKSCLAQITHIKKTKENKFSSALMEVVCENHFQKEEKKNKKQKNSKLNDKTPMQTMKSGFSAVLLEYHKSKISSIEIHLYPNEARNFIKMLRIRRFELTVLIEVSKF